MSLALAYLDGAGAILRRDIALFASYRMRLLSQVLGIVFSLTLFYYLSRIVSVRVFPSPDAYFAFVVVGLIVLRVLTSSFQTTAGTLRHELVAGTFERMVVSPFGAVAGVLSLLVFPFLLTLTLGVLSLALGAIVFGLEIQWGTAPLAVPVAVLGTMSFAPFALVIAAIALLFKQAAGATGVLLALISLVAGLYFPVAVLPDWIEWASEVQPFTPAVELLRHLLVGTEMAEPAGRALVKLAAFAAVLTPPAIWMVSRAIRICRRRATITEY